MKKLISLLFIIILMFFSNNTITNQDDIINNVNIEQILHCNNDMILTNQDNAKFIYGEKIISIINKKYNKNTFDYVYDKIIIKHNNTKCAITLYEENQRKFKFISNGTIYLLKNRLTKNSNNNKVKNVAIRGPCYKIAFLNDIEKNIFYKLKLIS